MNAIRAVYVRPIALGIALTAFGELLILVIWGVILFPGGDVLKKLAWTGTCGVAMGATIGALVNLFVTGRLEGRQAMTWTALIYFGVLSYCNVLCYSIDLTMGFFGAQTHPGLFLAGGFVPALVTSIPYAWLLFSQRGPELLAKVRL